MPAFRINCPGGLTAFQHSKDRAKRARNLRPALTAGAMAIEKLVADSFRDSVTPEGKAWLPLAESTVKRRRKGSDKPLIDTGILKNSVYSRADSKSIVFGTNVPYAAAQNFGASIKRVGITKTKFRGSYVRGTGKAYTIRIPPRAFLPWDANRGEFMTYGAAGLVQQKIYKYIQSYLETGKVSSAGSINF